MPENQSKFSILTRFFGIERLNWISFFIWTVGVVALTIGTTLGLLPLFSEYRKKNVAMNVEVLKSEHSRPPMTICLPYYSRSLSNIAEWLLENDSNHRISNSNCIECDALQEHSWGVWNSVELEFQKNEPTAEYYESTIATLMVKQLLKQRDIESFLTLNQTNFNWNQPIVDAVWRFLTCFTMQDFKFLTNDPTLRSYCRSFDFFLIGSVIDETLNQFFRLVVNAIHTYHTYSHVSFSWLIVSSNGASL